MPVLMTLLPSEVVKFDFPDCWAMVTVLPSDETYVAEYVTFFACLSLFWSCWICELLSPLAEAGRLGSTTRARLTATARPTPEIRRVRMPERYSATPGAGVDFWAEVLGRVAAPCASWSLRRGSCRTSR